MFRLFDEAALVAAAAAPCGWATEAARRTAYTYEVEIDSPDLFAARTTFAADIVVGC